MGTQHEADTGRKADTGRLCRSVSLKASDDGKTVLLIEVNERKVGIQREYRFEITTGELIALVRAHGAELPGENHVRTQTLPEREQRLTSAQFHQLADMPPEAEWFANLDTICARVAPIRSIFATSWDSSRSTRPEDFRIVTRAHVLAWRKVLEDRALSGASSQRFLRSSNICAKKRCGLQSGQGCKAAEGREQRRQDAGTRRSPSARAARCA
ncbi:ATPase involved in chromosome partitioning [Candidatus Paraburkholderia calva]|nr:ATPase involved in chromosome partitioning [Candidatus Paraburkholderia calva]